MCAQVTKMPQEKALPPTPTRSARSPVFSPEAYIRILEEENEQLRLLNQQLSQQRNILESKLIDETEKRSALSIMLSESKSELQARDAAMADIAATIMVAFRRYTNCQPPEDGGVGEIPICYSRFDDDSLYSSP